MWFSCQSEGRKKRSFLFLFLCVFQRVSGWVVADKPCDKKKLFMLLLKAFSLVLLLFKAFSSAVIKMTGKKYSSCYKLVF